MFWSQPHPDGSTLYVSEPTSKPGGKVTLPENGPAFGMWKRFDVSAQPGLRQIS
jgi:hypothetical protein